MKRPLSPSPPGEKEPPASGATECPPRPPELPKPKREGKRPSYTLCDVCNIQLNSAAQAQVHCGGRAHQRRLRQLSLGKTPAGPDPALLPPAAGPASSAPSPLLASLPLPARPLQPPLDFKHLLAFHFNGATPLSLTPNFSTMDPIQKAVISHTFGVPSPLKKKLFISCNICHLRFNSANQAEAHYKGHKHARKLKAVEAAKSKQRPQTLARDGVLVSPTLTPASGSPGEPHSKGDPDFSCHRSVAPGFGEPYRMELLCLASSMLLHTAVVCHFYCCVVFHLMTRETEHEWGKVRERGRHRIRNRLQAPSGQHRARCGGVGGRVESGTHCWSSRHRGCFHSAMPPPICHYLKSWPPDDSNPMRSISPAVPAAPPPAPILGPALFRTPAGAVRPATGPIVFAPY
ncbi:zinc finger protein 385c-like [Lynx pardinus]|uniref:Zinc finger protein 385c-like n=1 Tax=Lynx pardinus TaxID=191816 RepID=A0A485P471_LYNPA|nr:zinc finger protein 385c-like [Lynx pardinus]